MKRSKFSLSHYKLLTMDMGYLVPIAYYEVLPGDTMQQSSAALIRVNKLLAPVMHPCKVRIHHWYVPLRLIWEDFEEFITGGEDGTSTPTAPYLSRASVAESSLYDYLGVPPASYSPNLDISVLPIRAYNKIYNENYRDQDLVTETTTSVASGLDVTTLANLQRCSWEKDYFTTARPWEQKGDEVTIPITGDAPVYGIGKADQGYDESSITAYESGASASTTYADATKIQGSSGDVSDHAYIEEDPDNAGYPNIFADMSSVSAIGVNDLRLSLAVQRFQERMGISGSRYVEYLRALGIRSSDARLQNPEYLGGGRQVINFSEVLATDDTNTGDLYGHGISAMRTNKFRRFFEEHGIVLSLMSVIPKSIYTQSLNRKWTRTVKEDYFQRELQFIGQQEVYNKEVYTEHTTPDGIFGYQNRYDEYRSHPSGIAGEFHSTNDHWHLGRIFTSDPALNSTFIKAIPTKRVLASSGTEALYAMVNNSIQARRPISKVGKEKTF